MVIQAYRTLSSSTHSIMDTLYDPSWQSCRTAVVRETPCLRGHIAAVSHSLRGYAHCVMIECDP